MFLNDDPFIQLFPLLWSAFFITTSHYRCYLNIFCHPLQFKELCQNVLKENISNINIMPCKKKKREFSNTFWGCLFTWYSSQSFVLSHLWSLPTGFKWDIQTGFKSVTVWNLFGQSFNLHDREHPVEICFNSYEHEHLWNVGIISNWKNAC